MTVEQEGDCCNSIWREVWATHAIISDTYGPHFHTRVCILKVRTRIRRTSQSYTPDPLAAPLADSTSSVDVGLGSGGGGLDGWSVSAAAACRRGSMRIPRGVDPLAGATAGGGGGGGVPSSEVVPSSSRSQSRVGSSAAPTLDAFYQRQQQGAVPVRGGSLDLGGGGGDRPGSRLQGAVSARGGSLDLGGGGERPGSRIQGTVLPPMPGGSLGSRGTTPLPSTSELPMPSMMTQQRSGGMSDPAAAAAAARRLLLPGLPGRGR